MAKHHHTTYIQAITTLVPYRRKCYLITTCIGIAQQNVLAGSRRLAISIWVCLKHVIFAILSTQRI